MKKYNFTHDSKYVKKLVDEDFYNVYSYQELDNKIAALSPEEGNWQEGMAFEGWVEGFIKVIEESVETYIHSSKIPQETKDEWRFPVVKNKEYGIDSILYYHDDPMPMPVQIKFQSKKNKIDFAKLGTFGLAAQKFPYGRRLIIHNQVKVDDALPKDSYISIDRKDLDKLEPEDFQRINKWLKGVSVKKLKKKLEHRDYQDNECVPRVREELTNSDRAIIHAVQGSGKTVMVIKCILDLIKAAILKPNINAVILAPSRYLVLQWLNPIFRWIPKVKVLPICTPEELIEEGGSIQSMTGVVDIAKWFKENNDQGISIGLCTLNSYPVLAQAMKLAGLNKLDFGCVDEAHKATGLLIQRKTFFFQDRVLEISKRLAVGGTFLIREPAEGTGPLVSMDDVSLCGNVAFRYTRKRALEEGAICGHRRWYSVAIADLDIDTSAVEFEDELFRADWTAGLYAFEEFVEGKERDIKRCIVLHNLCVRQRAFCSDTPLGIKHHMKNVWVGYIDGEMTLNEKAAVIRDFREAESKGFKRAFLCLVGCGLEGMNIPEADGLWYADPKNSEITIDQVTGRVERSWGGKTIAHVGMPFHLKNEEEEEVEAAARRTGYEKALARYDRMDDDNFDGTVTLIQEGLIDRPKGPRPGTIGENVPDLIGAPTILAQRLREALEMAEFDRLYGPWERHYQTLVEFYNENGHTIVPQNNTEWGKLGKWVGTQRTLNSLNAPELTQYRKDKLNEIGFIWNVDDLKWEEAHLKHKTFLEDNNLDINNLIEGLTAEEAKNANGHKDKIKTPFLLGVRDARDWRDNQKKQKRKGKLAEFKIKKMGKLGIDWRYFWQISLDHNLELIREAGGPSKVKKGDEAYYWLSKQREAWKNGGKVSSSKTKGGFSQVNGWEYIKAELNKYPDMIWRLRDSWMSINIAKALAFIEDHGEFPTQTRKGVKKYGKDDKISSTLYQWSIKVREYDRLIKGNPNAKSDKLKSITPEMLEEYKEAGLPLNVETSEIRSQNALNENIKLLRVYYNANNHSIDIPRDENKSSKSPGGSFLIKLRTDLKSGKATLTEEQEKELKSMGADLIGAVKGAIPKLYVAVIEVDGTRTYPSGKTITEKYTAYRIHLRKELNVGEKHVVVTYKCKSAAKKALKFLQDKLDKGCEESAKGLRDLVYKKIPNPPTAKKNAGEIPKLKIAQVNVDRERKHKNGKVYREKGTHYKIPLRKKSGVDDETVMVVYKTLERAKKALKLLQEKINNECEESAKEIREWVYEEVPRK